MSTAEFRAAHKEEKAAYDKLYRAAHPEYEATRCRADYLNNQPARAKAKLQWREANPKRVAFLYQRKSAKRRFIVFQLTLEEWVDFWGDDFGFRGRGPDALCMGRFDDTGPYKRGNIYICSNSENREGPRPLPVPNF